MVCVRRPGVLLAVALSCLPLSAGVRAQEPAPYKVRPSNGTFSGLQRGSMAVARTLGERLDKGHDWLYRRLEKMLVSVDQRYAVPERAPLLVPLSPLRIDFATEFLNRQHGLGMAPRVEFDATLRLPNIERRMRIFISSRDLSEAPGNPAVDRNPLRAGVRFAPHAHIDVDFGVRVKLKPVAYAALRWAPQFDVGRFRLYPLVKPYLESGLGLGVSSGITLERWQERWVIRSSSFGNWRRTTAATSWDQTLMIGHAQSVIQERAYGSFTAGRDLACGTVLRVLATGDRLSSASRYEISVLFKRPLHGGWLYGYVEPLVRWERGSDWHPDSGIRVGVDALFWGLAADSVKAAHVCR